MKKLLIILCLLFISSCAYAEIVFDGVDDTIACGTGLDNMSKMTISFRGKLNTMGYPQTRHIMAKKTDSDAGYWDLFVENPGGSSSLRIGLSVDYSTKDLKLTSTNLSDITGEHLYTITWDGNMTAWQHMFLYLDGTKHSTYTTQTAEGDRADDSAATITIGGYDGGGENTFAEMTISEVAIWDTDLEDYEVKYLWNGGTPYKGKPLEIQPTHLVAYWAMDDETSGSADGASVDDTQDNADGTGSDGANDSGLTWADTFSYSETNPHPLGDTTWYIRTDGGTTTQCKGIYDAAYTEGTFANCAFNNPDLILTTDEVQSEDTVIIKNGSYEIDDALTLVSGTAGQYFKVYGEEYATGCHTAPELWVTSTVGIDVDSKDYLDLRCLEITDHRQCAARGGDIDTSHLDVEWRCGDDNGYTGIDFNDVTNVTMKDVNIHGMSMKGIAAGNDLADFDFENVRLGGNGYCGWCADSGIGSDTSGTFTFDKLNVEWNGCIELYPSEKPGHCYSQAQSGFGDGFSMDSGVLGTWIWTNSNFSHNVADGLDMIYFQGSPSEIVVRNTRIEGNGGQQFKGGADTVIFENNKVISNCMFFQGKDYTQEPLFDHCRNGGKAFSFSCVDGSDYYVYGNTFYQESGNILFNVGSTGCDGSETATIRGNIYMGESGVKLSYHNDGECTGLDLDDDYSIMDDNLSDSNDSMLGEHSITDDPEVVGDTTADYKGESMDVRLGAGSPAIGFVTEAVPALPSPYTALTTDFKGGDRTNRDAGYLEYSTPTKTGVAGGAISGGTVQ